jgi:hypothetical protein
MARVLLVCPFCQKRLETSEENVGREGQCPACENVFPVTHQQGRAPGIPAIGGADVTQGALQEYEYREMTVLVSVGAVAVCLGLLVIGSLLPWVKPARIASDFMPSEQMGVLVVTLACCVYMLLSFLSRKSLVPAVLTSAAWGTVVLIWTGGILQALYGVVQAAQNTPLAKDINDRIGLNVGIYVALAAGLLTTIAGVYFYYQSKESDTFGRLGAFLVATQVAAVLAGVLIVTMHAGPAIRSHAPRSSDTVVPQATAPQAPPLVPPGQGT